MKLRKIAQVRCVANILGPAHPKKTAGINYRSFTRTFIAIICIGPSILQSAQIQMTRIGNPVYKPAGFTPFAIEEPSGLSGTWKAILPEPNHMHIGNTKLPGQSHQGPYDTEISEGVAAAGYMVTDVFTVDEFTKGFTINPQMLVPDSNAPNGRSPDFDDGPVIPNETFLIERTINVLKNGVPFFSNSTVSAME